MKVKTLIEALQAYANPEDEVVMSRDEEGNGYAPLSDVDTENHVFVSDGCEGCIYLRKLTKELKKQGYSREDLYDGDDAVNCVVLWP